MVKMCLYKFYFCRKSCTVYRVPCEFKEKTLLTKFFFTKIQDAGAMEILFKWDFWNFEGKCLPLSQCGSNQLPICFLKKKLSKTCGMLSWVFILIILLKFGHQRMLHMLQVKRPGVLILQKTSCCNWNFRF
jgi:hypothetical protein